jgi:hypothetical protein
MGWEWADAPPGDLERSHYRSTRRKCKEYEDISRKFVIKERNKEKKQKIKPKIALAI